LGDLVVDEGIIFKVDVKRAINGSVCIVFIQLSARMKWDLCEFNNEASLSENIEKFPDKLSVSQLLDNFDEWNY
jgi:hypothetical protein